MRLKIPFELPPVSLGGGGGGEIMIRFPVKYSKLLSVFIEASRNLSPFCDIEDAKNLKTISGYTQRTDLIFKPFKKVFIS